MPTLGKYRWLRELLQIQSSVIPAIFPRVLFCIAFGGLISWLYAFGWPLSRPELGSLVPTLVLGLLLVFRTNTAYDRFWEGRKIWGGIINTVRNTAQHIWVFVEEQAPSERVAKQAILRLVVAFAIATKLHLRNEPVNRELQAFVSIEQYKQLQSSKHPPLEVIFWLKDYLNRQHQQGRLNTYQLNSVVNLLNSLVDYFGGCERILKTPLPAAYSIHLKQLIFIYCLILPFQLVAELGWLTGPSVGLISFTLLGIEEIGIEIENPFGRDPNDLPLDTICQTIAHNIEELSQLDSSASRWVEPTQRSRSA